MSEVAPSFDDPITFAVIKNAMDAIVDEVAYTVIRTARSEIVKDVMDYSAAICDAKGEMVAQAKTIAQHLGAIPEAMAAVQAKWSGCHIERSLFRRHALARHLHVLPDLRWHGDFGLVGRDLSPYRRGRQGAGIECGG
jgi:hypothetical protein